MLWLRPGFGNRLRLWCRFGLCGRCLLRQFNRCFFILGVNEFYLHIRFGCNLYTLVQHLFDRIDVLAQCRQNLQYGVKIIVHVSQTLVFFSQALLQGCDLCVLGSHTCLQGLEILN